MEKDKLLRIEGYICKREGITSEKSATMEPFTGSKELKE